MFGKQKPPSLEKILGLLDKRNKQMDAKDMLAEVKRLNTLFGGSINYESPG